MPAPNWIPTAMTSLLGLDPGQMFVIILVALGCFTAMVVSVVGIVSAVVDATHRRRIEADLKQDMLDRGMSADDIAKVVAAGPVAESPKADWFTAPWMNPRCKSRRK